jgi:hypothetical protein
VREYDATAHRVAQAAATRIASLVAGLAISGNVLELACGTSTRKRRAIGWRSWAGRQRSPIAATG